jgi:chromosome partitioning protein
MAVHVLLNQKGGVGKSTIAVNLAAVTADVLNHRDDPDASSPVAAISVDPQGSAVWWASRIDDLPFHIVQAHDDLAGLARIKDLPTIKHVYIDTPGWIDLDAGAGAAADPLGRGPAADALRAVLDVADQVIIPIETEPLSFDPTARTINKVVKPRGLPYTVVINNWDPRDGHYDLNETKEFIKRNGWPLANTVIRHYKLHSRASADGQVVTEYPTNRVALHAREEYYR